MPSPDARPAWRLVALSMALGLAVAFRSVHLGADPPNWYLTEDLGYHVDDGNKTLAAKNVALFGTTRWNAADRYPGWMKASPLTQGPYLAAFLAFGVDLAHARAVTIAYFAVFLVAAGVFCLWAYGTTGMVVGLALLAVDPALFLFSRTALFETAIMAATYLGIFLAGRVAPGKPLLFSAILVPTGVVAANLIKVSALIYVLPPVGVLAVVLLAQRFRSSLPVLAVGLVVLCALGGVLLLERQVWLPRLDVSGTLRGPQYLAFNPIPELSPLVLPMGLLSLQAILDRAPRRFLRDCFGMCLAAILVAVPLGLAMMYNNPPRYHVPVVPAGILLAVHWMFRYRPLPPEAPVQGAPGRLAVGAVQVGLAGLTVFSIYLALQAYLGDAAHWGRHLDRTNGASWAVALSLLAGGGLVLLRRRASRRSGAGGLVTAVLVGHGAVGLVVCAFVLIRPNYESEAILARMRRILQPGESVAGDWAPYLTASSDIPSLWLHPERGPRENHPCEVQLPRPDYFMLASDHDLESLGYLRRNPAIELGGPIPVGSFYRHEVLLYPLAYPPGNAGQGDAEAIERCLAVPDEAVPPAPGV